MLWKFKRAIWFNWRISNIKNEINLLLGEKGSRIKEEYKSLRTSLGTKGVSDRISAHIVNS